MSYKPARIFTVSTKVKDVEIADGGGNAVTVIPKFIDKPLPRYMALKPTGGDALAPDLEPIGNGDVPAAVLTGMLPKFAPGYEQVFDQLKIGDDIRNEMREVNALLHPTEFVVQRAQRLEGLPDWIYKQGGAKYAEYIKDRYSEEEAKILTYEDIRHMYQKEVMLINLKHPPNLLNACKQKMGLYTPATPKS